MTRLLDEALEAARKLPPAAQDDVARVVLHLVGADDEAPPVPLSPDQRAAIAASKSAASRDEFASDGAPKHNPVLVRFRQMLEEMYGPRLARVVLYGSRARGDAHADSDYDVAVFLRDMDDRFAELYRLADLSTEIIDETGEFVHAVPYRAGSENERTPVMLAIRTDGLEL